MKLLYLLLFTLSIGCSKPVPDRTYPARIKCFDVKERVLIDVGIKAYKLNAKTFYVITKKGVKIDIYKLGRSMCYITGGVEPL